MKKTKATFITMILLFALLCTVAFWYGSNGIAYAETTGQDLEILCEEYTSDLKLYSSTDEEEKLDNYESYLESRFQLSNFHNEDRTITDEWIMRIVPKRR